MHCELRIPVKTRFGDFIYDGFTNRIEMSGLVSGGYDRYIGVCGKSQADRFYERQHCLKSLTLQLTRRCNLRCSYCVYSGSFGHMHAHADESMENRTIHQAIDFLEAHSRESEHVTISFYGGESLLEFARIEDAVEYAGRTLPGRRITFSITSNGLLLKETVARFLDAHPNVQVQITLNGDMHDAFRKTPSGVGSLGMILDNLEKIRDHHPQVWEKQIQFVANIISYRELPSLKHFYQETVKKLPELITRITMEGCRSDVKQAFAYNQKEDLQLEAEFRKDYVETNDPFLAKIFSSQLQAIHERPILTQSAGLAINPTCSPMSGGIFVRTDGAINICERVTDNIGFGTVFDGYDNEKIDEYYDEVAHFTERNCMSCWAQHLCMLCFQQVVDETGRILDHMPAQWCSLSREYALRDLQSYIEIMISDPERFRKDG